MVCAPQFAQWGSICNAIVCSAITVLHLPCQLHDEHACLLDAKTDTDILHTTRPALPNPLCKCIALWAVQKRHVLEVFDAVLTATQSRTHFPSLFQVFADNGRVFPKYQGRVQLSRAQVHTQRTAADCAAKTWRLPTQISEPGRTKQSVAGACNHSQQTRKKKPSCAPAAHVQASVPVYSMEPTHVNLPAFKRLLRCFSRYMYRYPPDSGRIP